MTRSVRRAVPLLAAACALGLSGCLATRQEIEDLRVDIVELQKSLSRVQSLQTDSSNTMQGSQADMMAEMKELTRSLDVLSSRLQESDTQMTGLSGRLDDLDKNVSNRLDLLADLISGSKLAAPPSPSTLFSLAYGDYTRRRYQQAQKGFQAYLAAYPDTEKAGEAQFYVGECYFAQEQWSRALEAYDKVLVDFSTSTLVPTAYLQKGQALERLAKNSEALAVYEAVLRKYPNRREAGTARSRLEALTPASADSAPAEPAPAETAPPR
jgi:tol-pal system protein YbgF